MLSFLPFARKASSLSRIAVPNNKPVLILVVSIGNPETQYHGTRHSVGHMILKNLCESQGFSQVKQLNGFKFKCNADKPDVLLYQTPGFMNLSGKNLAKPWKAILAQPQWNPVLVVLHDELDLDLGKVRVRKQNSSARGHNGLRSIQQHIGRGYNAIQIGIGRDSSSQKDPDSVSKYVLSKFSAQEVEQLHQHVVPRVAAIIEEMRQHKHIFETL
ncbi:hypothetical protein KL930_003262 [Ogataea haglerorum]|uniref:peptidyl-tRNA hydrolase n=1 Tax=Ogataea haglerorum TaxID=1937702 RepID=A0AAN6HZM3_9ASCO|nr:uncharacterized protein KL911_002486 [Ogataea haglerorum]KAG7696235.1 hypothetical protein KL915_002599 [Ogataea haglerorum]KAG7696607.1 hypothetical protein KL951_003063 [Ogataea haglerorum]KAG7706949.1 hypothetical protein KL914_002833 [Ogataea haglerorum]KAG7708744.1 hypothetical protein KL950_002264 [Ogataea haglerorum]KAG7716239.1 hypothetical protein KL913_003450 [Ogataea haglerorum]